MLENRRHFRIREYLRVHWTVTAEKPGGLMEVGDATVLDISNSGMKILTDKSFKPFDKCIFLIESPVGASLPFGPQKAKMVWFRTVNRNGVTSFQCGLEFLKDFRFDSKLKAWLDEKVTKIAEATDARILTNYIT